MPCGCVDKDTEFLTPNGWKKISEYTEGDYVMQYELDGKARFVKPLRYIKEPEKKLYHFTTKYGLDQCLSLEHEVIYIDRKSNKVKKEPFYIIKEKHKKLKAGFEGRFIKTFTPIINTRLAYTNAILRLIVAVIADSSFSKFADNRCEFNLKRERKIRRLVKLLKNAKVPYKKYNKNAAGYIKILFKSPLRIKEFDERFYKASVQQLKIIADEVMYWDGCITQQSFSSTSKKSADFIQYCFTALGRSSSIYYDDRRGQIYHSKYVRKNITYEVCISNTNHTSMANSSSRPIPINEYNTLDGYKYCFEMPSGNLVLRRNNSIFITGNSGKTKTIMDYLKMLNLKTLVLVPTKDIRKQWQDYRVPNVTVSTYANPKLRIKGVMESFDIVVCDECHHASAKTIYQLMMLTKTDVILIGASATIKREDGEDLKVHGALGRIIYTITRKELIEQGYLANARVIYLKPKFQTTGKYMHYQEVYNLEIIRNEHRNNLVVSAAMADAQNQRKILILVSTIEHGEILYDKLKLFTELKTIFMNGQSKNRDQDMSKWDIIIATSIYDEGYDLPSLDTLILAGSGKSKIKVTQRVGRVLRVKPDGRTAVIYDFVDTPKYLRQQYMTRRSQLGQDFEVYEIDEQKRLMED